VGTNKNSNMAYRILTSENLWVLLSIASWYLCFYIYYLFC